MRPIFLVFIITTAFNALTFGSDQPSRNFLMDAAAAVTAAAATAAVTSGWMVHSSYNSELADLRQQCQQACATLILARQELEARPTKQAYAAIVQELEQMKSNHDRLLSGSQQQKSLIAQKESELADLKQQFQEASVTLILARQKLNAEPTTEQLRELIAQKDEQKNYIEQLRNTIASLQEQLAARATAQGSNHNNVNDMNRSRPNTPAEAPLTTSPRGDD